MRISLQIPDLLTMKRRQKYESRSRENTHSPAARSRRTSATDSGEHGNSPAVSGHIKTESMDSYREEEKIRCAAMTFAYNYVGRNCQRILSA